MTVVLVLVAVLAVLVAAAALVPLLRRRRPDLDKRTRIARVLVPFTGDALDETVLAAALRIARAEDATLVPAYLIVIPLELAPDAPMQREVAVAMPLLEAVEQAALRAGVPVDARVESGRTPIHALQRLWEAESFDRVVIPAPAGGRSGFAPKDLIWMLVHAPTQTLILRPTPRQHGAAPAPHVLRTSV